MSGNFTSQHVIDVFVGRRKQREMANSFIKMLRPCPALYPDVPNLIRTVGHPIKIKVPSVEGGI